MILTVRTMKNCIDLQMVEEQQNNHRSDNKRPSGPSMKKEFKKNV